MERRPVGGSGAMALLFQQRDGLLKQLAQDARARLIADHSTPTTLRFAVADWDTLPDFDSAAGWTPSNRLILLEIAPSGDRDSIRARFVIGPGPAAVRARYLTTLLTTMPTLSNRRESTGVWTRLGTETLVRDLNKESTDAETAAALATERLRIYAQTTIPAFTEALRALRDS